MNPADESCVLHSVFPIQITLTRFLNQLIGWVLYINFSQMFVSHLLQILWDCNYSQFNKYKGEKRKQLTYSKKKKENRTTFTNALYLSIVPNTASWLAKNRDAILALNRFTSDSFGLVIGPNQSPGSLHLTLHFYTFAARTRIFLPTAIPRAVLWCCHLARLACSTVGNSVASFFSFSFVENVVKIDRKMIPLFLVLLNLLAVSHATSKFNRRNV